MIIYHKDGADCVLFDRLNQKVDEKNLKNCEDYYTFTMKSKNSNLYRNINLIFFLKDDKGWNNLDEMLRINTWKS